MEQSLKARYLFRSAAIVNDCVACASMSYIKDLIILFDMETRIHIIIFHKH